MQPINIQNDFLVSFVLITHNRITNLVECIHSIQNQTYQNIEIILVDNNSIDSTVKVIQRDFPQIKLISLDTNLGVTGARNVGIKNSNGDVIVFIDDDCIIKDKYFVEKLNKFFKERNKVRILTFRIINYYTNETHSLEFPHKLIKLINDEFETSYFLGGASAIKREVFDRIGYFYDDYFYGHEELDFSWRAIEKGFTIFYSPLFVVYHKTSATARPSWRKIYYSTRNRIWLVFSFLPWYYIASHLIVWLPSFFILSLKVNQVQKFFLAVCDGFREWPNLRERRRMLKLSGDSRKKIRKLKGRLLY